MDYEWARQRARLNRLVGAILRGTSSLLSLDETKLGRAFAGQAHGGVRQVPLNRIVGSVNRVHEFDQDFNPRRSNTRERWERVNQAFLDDVILPPVVLQKVGDDYFVKDG